MAVALGDGGIYPAAGRISTIEHIVEIEAENTLLHYLFRFQSIAEINVRCAVAGQRTVCVLRIVKILTADIVGVPYSLQAFIVEIDETIQAKGQLGDTISTPVGNVCIEKSPYFKDEDNQDRTIYVTRSSMLGSISTCLGRLGAGILSEETTIIQLSYQDVSIQRAEEVLNTLVSVYNENWVKDKNPQISPPTRARTRFPTCNPLQTCT